jgi:O-antigen/teichoic acid export membrane protein
VRTVVLVRLLTPHDFGLVGVAFAVIACAEALSGTGVHLALQAAGEFADLAVAIPLALWTRSPWALACGWIAMWTARVAVSYVIHPYRPRPRFDRTQSRALLRYAWQVTGTGGVGWLLGGGVDALVGRVLGVEALGFYRMAKLIALVAPTEIAGVLSWVAIGAFARLGESADRLRAAFAGVLRVTLVPVVPICVGTALYAPEIAQFVFGPRWTAIVPVVRVMAMVGIVRAVMAVAGAGFQGRGQPKFQMYASVVELAVLLAVFVPLASGLGLQGAALAIALGAVVAMVAALPMLRHVAHVTPGDIASCAAWPLAASCPLLGLRALAGTETMAAPPFLGAVAASALAYLAGMLLLESAGLAPPGLLAAMQDRIRRRAARSA